MDENEAQGVCYPQPTTLDERIAIARDFVERENWQLPLLVDEMDNQVDWIFGAWPERLYVIGTDGKIAYKGETGPFGFHPAEVEAWLERNFPDVPASKTAAEPTR